MGLEHKYKSRKDRFGMKKLQWYLTLAVLLAVLAACQQPPVPVLTEAQQEVVKYLAANEASRVVGDALATWVPEKESNIEQWAKALASVEAMAQLPGALRAFGLPNNGKTFANRVYEAVDQRLGHQPYVYNITPITEPLTTTQIGLPKPDELRTDPSGVHAHHQLAVAQGRRQVIPAGYALELIGDVQVFDRDGLPFTPAVPGEFGVYLIVNNTVFNLELEIAARSTYIGDIFISGFSGTLWYPDPDGWTFDRIVWLSETAVWESLGAEVGARIVGAWYLQRGEAGNSWTTVLDGIYDLDNPSYWVPVGGQG